MEDALKAAFESQFGTEWSRPVVAPSKGDEGSEEEDFQGFGSNSDAESDSEINKSSDESDSDGPITIKHTESLGDSADQTQSQLTKAQRRRFLNSGAPKDDTIVPEKRPETKEDQIDLQNDLELQRLIEESHILHERPKGQEFTGADISGVGDPMELVGQNRIKLMQARMARAGAKQTKARIPQRMAVGIRNKSAERASKVKQEAREGGIVLARERHERSKNRRRDTGLRINTIGRASEHGIHISPAERDRIKKQAQASKPRSKRRK